MKKSLFTIIVLLVLMLLSSCDPYLTMYVENRTDRNIIPFLIEYHVGNNDIVLPAKLDDKTVEYLTKFYLATPQESTECFSVEGLFSWREYWPNEIDTLHLFILDADTLQKYGWEEGVERGNMLLQRYDLGIAYLDDMERASWVYYPPTSQMAFFVKMWPPYNFDE